MSANPLKKSQHRLHVPLLLLALGFGFPLLWLVSASLQPREQVAAVPPQWIPRRFRVTLSGSSEKVFVTPPQRVGVDSVLVVPRHGPEVGSEVLVPTAQFNGEMVKLRVQEADTTVLREFPAVLKQSVPAHFVLVKEWQLSKHGQTSPRTFYVEEAKIEQVVAPVLGNYPEAIRALTANEADKALPLGELLQRTRWPWTPAAAEGRTITFLSYLVNTLIVALLGVIGATLSSALAAYGLSRINWRGSRTLFAITLATMMVPFPVLMVPLYSLFRDLDWLGTLKPLWVPAFFGSAFNIFLLRQFFLTIPKDLSEAARIDGCSELQIFWRIILPLARPALSVVALFHFLFAYNDFLGPLLFLPEPSTFTMALGLQQYQSQLGGSEWHLLLAASVILVLPVVVLFFLAQKTFIQGISTTGMKG